jgi:hypothetical protein
MHALLARSKSYGASYSSSFGNCASSLNMFSYLVLYMLVRRCGGLLGCVDGSLLSHTLRHSHA